ncbi:MAG: hypothetical protein EP330_30275 [Deltaproteobacteria bacterium]|nr:MAG: hypothetical protein EP330_30275 [Deltaproteobacteria bacterium]
MSWQRAGVEVRALGGGLYLEEAGYGLLLDAPVGVAVPRPGVLGTIALSGGRIGSVGGLVPLLCALEPHRDPEVPLSLVGPLGDDRGARLAEAWSQGWPGRYAVRHDALSPGQVFDAGPFEVETVAIVRGEPRWRPEPAVERVSAMAFRVHTAAGVVAFVPGAAPGSTVARCVADAALAVIEVGTEPWPVDERRWRMSEAEALALDVAGERWVLDERGLTPGGWD